MKLPGTSWPAHAGRGGHPRRPGGEAAVGCPVGGGQPRQSTKSAHASDCSPQQGEVSQHAGCTSALPGQGGLIWSDGQSREGGGRDPPERAGTSYTRRSMRTATPWVVLNTSVRPISATPIPDAPNPCTAQRVSGQHVRSDAWLLPSERCVHCCHGPAPPGAPKALDGSGPCQPGRLRCTAPPTQVQVGAVPGQPWLLLCRFSTDDGSASDAVRGAARQLQRH
jgi:hypothetical protein